MCLERCRSYLDKASKIADDACSAISSLQDKWAPQTSPEAAKVQIAANQTAGAIFRQIERAEAQPTANMLAVFMPMALHQTQSVLKLHGEPNLCQTCMSVVYVMSCHGHAACFWCTEAKLQVACTHACS